MTNELLKLVNDTKQHSMQYIWLCVVVRSILLSIHDLFSNLGQDIHYSFDEFRSCVIFLPSILFRVFK